MISFRVRSADKRPSSCLQVLRDNKHRHSRRDTSHASKKDFFALCWPTTPTFSFQAARQPKRKLRHWNAWRYSFQFLRSACTSCAILTLFIRRTDIENSACNIMRFSDRICIWAVGMISDELWPSSSLADVTFTSRSFKVENVSGEENPLDNLRIGNFHRTYVQKGRRRRKRRGNKAIEQESVRSIGKRARARRHSYISYAGGDRLARYRDEKQKSPCVRVFSS